ncbi:glycosyltransferase [Euzebya sp.]|uniref:glycosyltransferase n=1 Tax=Euzebya sp. TaxID=1971409 RepID=UPI003517A791
MRIALIASVRHGLRAPHAGGLERHTADLSRALRDQGHEVAVYASGDSDPELRVTPICPSATRLDFSDAARGDVSMLSDRFMDEHHAYLSLMLSLADADVDVVHDNSLHYLPVAMARTLRAPVVKVLHTPPTPWLESAIAHRDRSTVLVSVSHANAATWSTPVDAVIHNGIDLDRFLPGAGGDGTAVWVGRLVPEKAPHEALRAARLADLDLAVVGPAPDADYFAREVRPLLDDRRTWLGHLDGDAIIARLQAADVAVVTPAWDEPFGLVVTEALACGVPVAGYARGALPEIVTPDCGVLVPPGDLPGLARALRQAMALDRSACRRRAEALGSIDRMARSYLQVYEAALT